MNDHQVRHIAHRQGVILMSFLSAWFLVAFAAEAFCSFLFAAFASTGWPVGIATVLLQQSSQFGYLLLGSLQGSF